MGRARAIERVGIVGAGQMGNGIAQVMAQAGLGVLMTDASARALAVAPGVVGRTLDRQVSEGALTAEARAVALARLATTPDLADLGSCDLVIEAATGREEVETAIVEALVARLGKTAATVEDVPAFIVNRVLAPMINEAIFALFDGVGDSGGDRRVAAAGGESPDGAAGTRRRHRARHLPRPHERAP